MPAGWWGTGNIMWIIHYVNYRAQKYKLTETSNSFGQFKDLNLNSQFST